MTIQSGSPIDVLENNILYAFENADPGFADRLRQAVATGKVLPEIALRGDLVSPEGPQAKVPKQGAPAEIFLHVTHLELLWSFIYSWMVLYEEEVQKTNMAIQEGKVYTPDTDLCTRANELRCWAESIAEAYTPWPPALPSPTTWASLDEELYARKVNLVFQEAAAFLLLHEWAHSTSDHLQPGAEPSDLLSIEMEKEADNVAYDVLVGDRGDHDKLHLAWAVLSALLSSFYLLNRSSKIRQKRHPQIHHRIEHLLLRLDIQGEGPRAYFHGLCVEVLRHVFSHAPWSDPTDKYETAEELLQSTLDQLDLMLDESAEFVLRLKR